ncbi:MAG: hypothetical protein B6U72_03030 [Candidatus Altiarchaeales archaeon ex4484_2]|nr:MAG: hypothetical protein B6U72_03030 [Candidatus Altiarchaeales archaeon ex4484_2]
MRRKRKKSPATRRKRTAIAHKGRRKKTKRSYRQTGSDKGLRGVQADLKRKAKAPGRRKSKTGKRYYERRKNRSDKPGSRL